MIARHCYKYVFCPPCKGTFWNEVTIGDQLTTVSQMEFGCARIWRLTPTTQTQVGGTPHKPAQPATQPRAPPTTPDPKPSTRHTEQWVQWKNYWGEAPASPRREGEKLESTRTLSQAKATRPCAGACLICKRAADRWNCPKMPWAHPAINPNANAMPMYKSLNNNWFMESVRLLSYGCM